MTTETQPKTGKDDKGRSKPVVTPVAIASFPHLDSPDSGGGKFNSEPRYKIDLLWSKDTDLAVLKAAVKEAAIMAWGKDVNFKELAMPFKDGDEKSELEGYAGQRYITAKTKNRPGVVGPDTKPLAEGLKVYGGCFVRANVTAFTYSSVEKVRGQDGKLTTTKVNGVSFALNHVQFIKDGKPFGGGSVALSDAFDAMEPDLGGTEGSTDGGSAEDDIF